jgi:hypothetical protein
MPNNEEKNFGPLEGVTVQSVQRDRNVEVPGSAYFDHVNFAGQCGRERAGENGVNSISFAIVNSS